MLLLTQTHQEEKLGCGGSITSEDQGVGLLFMRRLVISLNQEISVFNLSLL